jgi:hypothetical protein
MDNIYMFVTPFAFDNIIDLFTHPQISYYLVIMCKVALYQDLSIDWTETDWLILIR